MVVVKKRKVQSSKRGAPRRWVLDYPPRSVTPQVLYDFEALQATVPEVLASVSNANIHSFYRLALRAIDDYSAGMQYGAEEFE